MNAIEELRNNLAEFSVDWGSSDHDAKCIEWYMLLDRIENEYMELPRDKNGEVIHVGDTVVFNNDTRSVYAVAKDVFVPLWPRIAIASDRCTLVKHDTWERIEADALMSAEDYTMAYDPRPHKGGVRMRQCRDLVRRCKALAAVEYISA